MRPVLQSNHSSVAEGGGEKRGGKEGVHAGGIRAGEGETLRNKTTAFYGRFTAMHSSQGLECWVSGGLSSQRSFTEAGLALWEVGELKLAGGAAVVF